MKDVWRTVCSSFFFFFIKLVKKYAVKFFLPKDQRSPKSKFLLKTKYMHRFWRFFNMGMCMSICKH